MENNNNQNNNNQNNNFTNNNQYQSQNHQMLNNSPSNIKRGGVSGKDILLYIFSFVSLISLVSAFLSTVFDAINLQIPDALSKINNYSYIAMLESMRWNISVAIVSSIIFIFTSKVIAKNIAIDPSKKDSSFRRFFVYLAILISCITLITSFVWGIYLFLGGELLARTILKGITLITVSGLIGFYYYYSELIRDFANDKLIPKLFTYTLVLVVFIGFSYSISVIGGPSTARIIKFDEKRVQSLIDISMDVDNLFRQGKFTNNITLKNLIDDNYYNKENFLDPKTGEEYKLSVVSYNSKNEMVKRNNYDTFLSNITTYDAVISVCANFEGERNKNISVRNELKVSWDYKPGENCYNVPLSGEYLTLTK